MKYLISTLLLLGLLALGCTDDQENTTDHPTFIFGIYHGFCQGNCAHFFKYEEGGVFLDEVDRYVGDDISFERESNAELVTRAKKLLDNLPEELIANMEDRYGCPDCADQGTLYLQLEMDSGTRIWYIDPRPADDWSKELVDYTDELKSELDDMIIR